MSVPGPTTGLEPCSQCGTLLAADQRYCLNCGRRRGEPRVDYRRQLPATEQNGHAPVESAPAPEPEQRDFAPLAAAGGIAVLGLMLLVGVLIGRGSGDNSAPAPAAPVVVREGGGTETAAEGAGKGSGALEAKAKPSKQAKGGKKGNKVVEAPPQITASDDELRALEESSGENYSESSAKIPNEVAIPGPAPPEDNKAPGGGSSGTTIE